MASNYATSQDLDNLRKEVLQLTTTLSQDNIMTRNTVNDLLLSQREIQQELANVKLNGNGKSVIDVNNTIGGPRGTGWVINNPASIAEYRASKSVVSNDYYDCANKKVTDVYGREMPDPANQLPYWSCPGDPASYAIDREDYISRLAFPDLNPYPMQVPFGLQI